MRFKILGLVILLLGLTAGLFLVQRRQLSLKRASTSGATLALAASGNPVAINAPFTVDIFVNPNHIGLSAADLVLTFPTDKLTLQNIQIKKDFFKTFVPVLTDNTGNFDLNRVLTQANQTGRLEFGAVTFDWPAQTTTAPVTTAHTLATLTFSATNTDSAQVVFTFDPATPRTTDTNLVAADTAADVLAQANPLNLTITPASPPTSGPTATSAPTPTATLTPVPTLTSTPIPPLIPTPSNPPTPSLPPASSLSVKFKFQGITDNRAANKTVKLLDAETLASYDANGVYLATNNNLPAGSYTVLLKGWAHLQNNCGSVTLNSGETRTVDCTAVPLKAGDIDGNNLIESKDIGYMLSAWTEIDTPVTDSNRQDDLDLNGLIQSKDIGYALANWLE